jgi:hypothetical protein
MDSVKQAFQRVKQDIDLLKKESESLKQEIYETRQKMIEICEILVNLKDKIGENTLKVDKIRQDAISTHKQENTTNLAHDSTHRHSFNPLKPQILPFSTGNQGVPTDRQTDRQTDQQTQKTPETQKNSFQNASEVLDSLDNIKKELRLKFKRLTEQEFLVFSTIYQKDEGEGFSNYKTLSETLKLSESSIRDYVGRLIKKGIPIEKNKINNKNIQISLSKDLKKIATLPTIMKLRAI